MAPRALIATYFLLQAVATAGWWGMLLSFPSTIKWFQPTDWPAGALSSFWLADFILIVVGSALASITVCKRHHLATTVVWSSAIVTWYPTLVCIATSVHSGQAWIASAMMVSMSGLSLVMATIHGNQSQMPATIRVTPMSYRVAIAWTIGQTAIFWTVFLYVLPMGIVELEQGLRWQPFVHQHQFASAISLLFIASCLGLWSGITMAVQGCGTPLPTATAPQLVVAGPYRFVRNPMAVAGIAQGIAVGWLLGSTAVIAYSLSGAVLWHTLVRPVEEVDLVARFGQSYLRYREQVRVWLPTLPSEMAIDCDISSTHHLEPESGHESKDSNDTTG